MRSLARRGDLVKGRGLKDNALYARVVNVAVGAAIIGAMLVNVGYTQHVAQVADRRQAELRVASDLRWCELFALLDPPGAPPTTDRGRLVQDQIRLLQAAFHCQEVRPR